MNKRKTLMTRLLFVCLVMTSLCSFSQRSACVEHTIKRTIPLHKSGEAPPPFKIVDQYGNEFSARDIVETKSRATRSSCSPDNCVAGLFTLHFEDARTSNGKGFDDCTASGGSTIGQLRQAVVCQVFRDISNLLHDVKGGANNGRTNIRVLSNTSYTDSIGPWPAGVDGLNSSFYVLPNGLNNVVLDNEVWKTIRGGANSYSGLPAAYMPSAGPFKYHGMLAFNFGAGTAWNLNLDAASPSGITDLYTAVLHEAIHCLGFNSLIAANSSSKLGSDIFSRYDTYLRLNTTPLISFTSPDNWAAIGGLSGIGCNNSQAFNFNGPSLVNQTVFTQAAWSNGTNLNHFGCDFASGSSCGPAYALPASDYVMNPCYGQGPAFTKRHPNLAEVRSLCDLGYRMRISGGNATYGDAASLSASAEPFVQSNFADCSGACIATGYTDNFTTAFDQTITITHPSLLFNDVDNNGTNLTIAASVVLPRLYTPLAGTLTDAGGILTFNPSANFTGTAVIGYYPRCMGSTVLGNLTFAFIQVAAPALPQCAAPGLCNMICNGDFEASNFEASWADLDVLGVNSNTPKLFEYNGTSTKYLDVVTGVPTAVTSWNYGCMGSVPIRNPAANGGNQYLMAGGHPSNVESFTFHLNSPMVAGSQYILSFMASGPGGATAGCLPANLRVHGDDMPPCPISQTTKLDGTVSTCGFTAVNLGTSANIDTPVWKPYSITMNPTSTITDLVLSLVPGTQPNSFSKIALFDNFELKLVNTASAITIASTVVPAPVCTNTSVQITYTVCLAPGQATNANAIPLQLGLPAGFAVVGGSFNSSGLYTIAANALTSGNPCVTLTTSLSMDQNLVFAGTSYNISLTPALAGACVTGSNPQNLTTITPVAPAISLIKTASTITPVNGEVFTYFFEVCNRSPIAQTVTLTDTVPTGFNVYTLNGFTQSGQIMSRTITLAGGTPNNPYCQQYSFTVKPNLSFPVVAPCNYQSAAVSSTATAQYTGSTCGAVSSTAALTVYTHYVVGSDVNIPTVSKAIAQGMLLPGTGTANSTNTGQTFVIAGSFAVDIDYVLGNTSSLVTSNAYCTPGSSVNVNSSVKFSAYYVNFNSCSLMWRGITVAGQIPFSSPEGELVLDNCVINDALYGVKANDLSKLSLIHNLFNECFVGLYLPQQSWPAPNLVLTLPISGNSFLSLGNMKYHYSGMTSSPQQPPLPSLPLSNRRTWAGIHIEGWNSLGVGTTAAGFQRNYFRGIANGIVSKDCDLNIVNSSFDHINAYGYNFNGQQGNAIHCSSNVTIYTNGQFYPSKGLYQRGLGFNLNGSCIPSFELCDNGIVASGMNLDVANNCFSNMGTGITLSGAKYGTIRINSNNFTTSAGTLMLTNNDPVNIMDISTNIIGNTGGIAAVSVQEQNNPPVQYATIHNNNISITGNTWLGIYLNACTGIAGLFSSYTVYSNTVILKNPASHLYGIFYSGCHAIDGFLNAAGGANGVSPATSNMAFLGQAPIAIAYSGSDGRFSCDSTFRLYGGIKLFGTCLNSTFSGTVMNTHTYGFHVSNPATLQAQGSATVSNGMHWFGSYTGGNAARNDNSSPNGIFVKGPAAPYWAPAVATVFPTSGWFLSSTGNPYQCNSVVYGAGFKKEQGQEISESERSVMNDKLKFTDFEESLKWQNERVVFDRLKSIPGLVEQDTEASAFVQQQSTTPLGALSNAERMKNEALQPEPENRASFISLAAEKELLTAKQIAIDSMISDQSNVAALKAWRDAKSGILQRMNTVNTSMGQLRQRMGQSRVSKLSQLTPVNEQIAAELRIEKNQKLLNSIYLETIAAEKYEFTDAQLKDLEYLAAQCPLEGGDAVFRSRSMLSLVRDTFYSDIERCATAAIAEKQTGANATGKGIDGIRLSTFPNPASERLTLLSNITTEQVMTVIIYDNLGRIVKQQNIQMDGKRATMDTRALIPGIYYIKVSDAGNMLYSGKFNIQR